MTTVPLEITRAVLAYKDTFFGGNGQTRAPMPAHEPGKPYRGMFRARYGTLRGRDWVRHLAPEDLQAFTALGRSAFDHGRMGGRARAQAAARDRRGRFTDGKIEAGR